MVEPKHIQKQTSVCVSLPPEREGEGRGKRRGGGIVVGEEEGKEWEGECEGR